MTDVIPRVTIKQFFIALRLAAERDRGTFEDIRQQLQQSSRRRAPPSAVAMWTSTRDAIAELARLGYATTGPLPRKKSEVGRLRDSPWEVTESGRELAVLHEAKQARGYDVLLLRWA